MTLKEYIGTLKGKTKGKPQSLRTIGINNLAAHCHVSPATVYRWVAGAVEPAYLYKEKVSEITGIPVEELFPSQE